MKSKKTGSNVVTSVVIGASVAALAAGAYFFLGSNGKKNRKHVKAWAVKMKADVIEKLEMTKELSESAYNDIIDTVAQDYKKGKMATNTEINELALDLKKHWKTIGGGAKAAKHVAIKDTKKIVRKGKNIIKKVTK